METADLENGCRGRASQKKVRTIRCAVTGGLAIEGERDEREREREREG